MSLLLVLDFDGTMTDAEAEGAPYREGYFEDVAVLVDRSRDETFELVARLEAEIAENPAEHGWLYGGHIVAPAAVDPYLRVIPVARKIFDICGLFGSEPERTRLLDTILYKYNYQKTRIVFRPGARDTLLRLARAKPYVVSNSYTDPVREKIRVLDGGTGELEWLLDRVHGRARKYVVDDDFDAVDRHFAVPGLSRPVLLRRPHYYEVLAGLLRKEGAAWEEMVVVGDIFELDLALPLAMGARVGLVANDFTPDYEKAFLAAHERAVLIESLSDIPAMIGA